MKKYSKKLIQLQEQHIPSHPEKATWGQRKYQRHSVDNDPSHFCGWQILLKCLSYANNEDEKNLIAFAFETGGRISEVLQLRTDMFIPLKETKPPILLVRGMPLVKHHKRTDLSQSVRHDFAIRIDDPLVKIMLHAIVKNLQENQPFIFLNPTTGRLYDRRWAYKVLRRIGAKAGIYLYPQRLRCERAYHLGKSLKAESLAEWFSWDNWNTAKRYSKPNFVDLAKELCVDVN